MSLDWGRAEECRIRHNDAECGPTPATPWRARSAQSDSENDGRRIVGRISRSADRDSTRQRSQQPRSRVRPPRRRTKSARNPQRVSPVRRREAAERKTDRRRSHGRHARVPTNSHRRAASSDHANGRRCRSCRFAPTLSRPVRAHAAPPRANLPTGRPPPQRGRVVGPATAWMQSGKRRRRAARASVSEPGATDDAPF